MGYQIPFKSFNGTNYVLKIDGGGDVIDGAAQVFVTNEDDDTDFFLPVRTQSGTFRYLGEGANDRNMWLNMIPQDALDIPVKLIIGTNSIMWQGYIQPEVYQNDYPANGGLIEHEFSVQCPLAVLDTMDISTANLDTTPIVTIGQLLQNYIFNRLTGTTINDYYFQGTLAATSARLNLKVMRQNFIETNTNGVSAKYTLKEVLEEVCKLFGYTCRMHGTSVYFTMPVTKTGHSEVGFTRYTDLTSTVGASYSARGTFTINDTKFCDNNNVEQVLPGIGTVTVKSDINELDNLIEIPYEEIYNKYNTGQSDIIIRSVDYYERNVYNLIRQPDANNTTLTYENDTVTMECYMANKPGTTQDAGKAKKFCRLFVYDDDDVGNVGGTVPESKGHYNWRKCIELFHSYEYTGSNTTTMFKITSKQAFVVNNGMLYIDFNCHHVSAWLTEVPFANRPKATARLKIGNKYWNGSTWTTTASNFNLPFNSEGAQTNRSSYGGINAPQYDGLGIPVTDTLQGIIEFSILDVPAYNTGAFTNQNINGFLPLMDFKIGFVRGTIEEKDHRGNEYVEKGGRFKQSYNVDLIFACDVTYGPQNYQRHMPAGKGYILNNSDEMPASTIPSIDGNNVIAEQELAQIIAQYGMTTHRLVAVNLWNNNASKIVPTLMSTGMETGMFPIAISHDWREDIVTVTMVKL
jgi:hypothetical protein